MRILNRQRRITNADRSTYIVSEYRYEPQEDRIAASAAAGAEDANRRGVEGTFDW